MEMYHSPSACNRQSCVMWGPGTWGQSKPPMWVADAKYLSHQPIRVCISKKLESRVQFGLESRNSTMGHTYLKLHMQKSLLPFREWASRWKRSLSFSLSPFPYFLLVTLYLCLPNNLFKKLLVTSKAEGEPFFLFTDSLPFWLHQTRLYARWKPGVQHFWLSPIGSGAHVRGPSSVAFSGTLAQS